MAMLRWDRPRLHTGAEGGEAKVTSVDLFYDLVFAVVAAQLASALAGDVSLRGLVTFVVLSTPAVRLWISQTLYSDRFESLDVSYRLFVFSAMLPAAGLAVAAPSGLAAGFPLYATSVIAGRIVLAGQWLRSGRYERRVMPLAVRYALFFGIETVLWAVAVFTSGTVRFSFVAAAIVADLLLPMTTTRRQGELGEFSREHLSDRFGAFFLVVLGQLVIVAILIMTRMRQPSEADLAAGALSFALAFVLWWIYVDHVVGRPLRPGSPWNAIWVYLHIPLFLSAAAVGSGVFTFVSRGERVVPDPARLLLCASFGIAVLFAGLAETTLVPLRGEKGRLKRTTVVHVVPATLSVALGVLGHGLAAIPLMLLLLTVGLVALLSGEYLRAGV
ncbi:MAG TPA: low temperature requirement protein A [Coriobacteriia bacterium]|jgi:low temperature requirement protein LtrA